MFFKIIVLKKFCKFHRKTPVSKSFLINLKALRTPTALKRDSNTDFFQRNQQNFKEHFVLKTAATASAGLRFPTRNLLKRCFFSVNFTKFLRRSFGRTTPDDCSLCLFENFEKFFRMRFSYSSLFHVQVTKFKPPDTVRNYFTSAFQLFYTGTTSSHSKTLKS